MRACTAAVTLLRQKRPTHPRNDRNDTPVLRASPRRRENYEQTRGSHFNRQRAGRAFVATVRRTTTTATPIIPPRLFFFRLFMVFSIVKKPPATKLRTRTQSHRSATRCSHSKLRSSDFFFFICCRRWREPQTAAKSKNKKRAQLVAHGSFRRTRHAPRRFHRWPLAFESIDNSTNRCAAPRDSPSRSHSSLFLFVFLFFLRLFRSFPVTES